MDCQATISRIVPSETECTTGALGNETIERASRSFRIDGALIIEDVVDAAISSMLGELSGKRISSIWTPPSMRMRLGWATAV